MNTHQHVNIHVWDTHLNGGLRSGKRSQLLAKMTVGSGWPDQAATATEFLTTRPDSPTESPTNSDSGESLTISLLTTFARSNSVAIQFTWNWSHGLKTPDAEKRTAKPSRGVRGLTSPTETGV